jgi:hypothetical protein
MLRSFTATLSTDGDASDEELPFSAVQHPRERQRTGTAARRL